MTFATTICLGKGIYFAAKLENICDWCERSVSISSYAADIICVLFSNILGCTVWMPDADVVINTSCRVCDWQIIFCAKFQGRGEISTRLVSFLLLMSPAPYNDVGFW